MFKLALSISRGRGAHNKIAMRERIRWARIAVNAGDKLLDGDRLDRHTQKDVKKSLEGLTTDEVLHMAARGKIRSGDLEALR